MEFEINLAALWATAAVDALRVQGFNREADKFSELWNGGKGDTEAAREYAKELLDTVLA